MKKRILVVAAHPDDEILGCGGTVTKRIKEGCSVSILILGEGITARSQKRARQKKSGQIRNLKQNAERAARIIGARDVFLYNFPDNRLDSVPLLDIVKVVEGVKRKVRPDVVFTHHWNDLNIDHRITYKAVLTACRPVEKETVKEIYSFQIPSSTEWEYPVSFNPNLFIDISKTLNKKIAALKAYDSEIRRFPHPRSEKAVKAAAATWGSVSGLKGAEAFETVRVIK